MNPIIGLTYNMKKDWQYLANDPIDAAAELQSDISLNALKNALIHLGYEVKLIAGVSQLIEFLINNKLRVDFVFNIAEGFRGRNRESVIPALLDEYRIPYVGSDALTMGISLDKNVAKQCFAACNIPTPKSFLVPLNADLSAFEPFHFPLFVKAVHEGSSKSINTNSRVENIHQLEKQIQYIHKHYQQAALVEQFIHGTEFTIGIIGNEKPEIMPIIQYILNGVSDLGNNFYTSEYNHKRSMTHFPITESDLDQDLVYKLKNLALKAYNAIGCRDYGRIDFRVDEQGNPFVLEVNPLPDLTAEDHGAFSIYAKTLNLSYPEIIAKILKVALDRFSYSL